jgi:hypothetical protein
MPAAEPLQVGKFVVVSCNDVVAIGSLIWATSAIVQGGFTLVACSDFGLFPQYIPIGG